MIKETIMSRKCWTLEEIYELIEKLLAEKCVITIRSLPVHSTGAYLVEWKQNRQLLER